MFSQITLYEFADQSPFQKLLELQKRKTIFLVQGLETHYHEERTLVPELIP